MALPVLGSGLPQPQPRHRPAAVGPPLVAIYLVADVGSIGGGWLSSTLIKRGWTVNAGRKTAMLVCALAVLPMMFASGARDLWVAVGVDQPRGRRAPGLVRQPLHAGLGHVPAAGGRLGRRPRRHGGRGRRHADRQADRLPAAGDRQLRAPPAGSALVRLAPPHIPTQNPHPTQRPVRLISRRIPRTAPLRQAWDVLRGRDRSSSSAPVRSCGPPTCPPTSAWVCRSPDCSTCASTRRPIWRSGSASRRFIGRSPRRAKRATAAMSSSTSPCPAIRCSACCAVFPRAPRS